MKTKKMVTLIIFILIVGAFVVFNVAVSKNLHSCQEGSRLGTLEKDDKVYLECGNETIKEDYKEIEGNHIVKKTNVIVEGSSHIEVFNRNWTDEESTTVIVLVGAIVIIVCLVILGMIMEE